MKRTIGRRTFLRGSAALGGSLTLLSAPRAPWVRRRPSDRPDILVLVGDDFGWPDLEGYTAMPSFDRHRIESLVFENAFALTTLTPRSFSRLFSPTTWPG